MGAIVSCIALNLCECAACMACSCCAGTLNIALGTAARFGHLLVFVGLFALAAIMGTHYQDSIVGTSTYNYYYVDVPDSLNIEGLIEGCNADYIEECVYRQLMYRASCVLTLFFGGMTVIAGASDYVNRSMWTLKIMLVVGIFIAFWYGDNSFFSGFAELARVTSFFWLLIQGLLMLDIAHDLHDIIMHKATAEQDSSGGTSNTYLALYLLVAAGFLTLASLGLHYLFADYAGCDTGMFFIVVTLVMAVLQTIMSSLNSVNRGILTPLVMFAYATFICWYALLSSPEPTCNPSAGANNDHAKSISVGFVTAISLLVLLFCVGNGSRILQIFLISGQGVLETSYGGYTTEGINKDGSLDGVLTGQADSQIVQDRQPTAEDGLHNNGNTSNQNRDDPNSTGTYRERTFFHFLMTLAACYGAMVLTSWGKPDGSPETSNDYSYSGSESMWLKIISQWVFFAMYWKALQVAYVENTS